jgi:hypothetical protein
MHSVLGEDTWDEAHRAVHHSLPIPSNLPSLVRASWSGAIKPPEFVHAFSVPGYTPHCLLRAAQIVRQGEKLTAAEIQSAVEILGVRASAVILAINTICEATLDSGPAARIWTPLFKEMMSEIEIGYHFGSSAEHVGFEKGMLVGFSRLAGLVVLLASNQPAFTDWYQRTGGQSSAEEAVATFGCEPYQVSSLLMQRLGLGPEIAIGTAVTLGALHPSVVEAKPTIQIFNAAFHWIHALKAGRKRPCNPEALQLFPELSQLSESEVLPVHLEMLFEEVDKLRNGHSIWTWHLPLDSYEETARAIVYKVKSKPYGATWSRGLATRETAS